jgi:hypothetical protein
VAVIDAVEEHRELRAVELYAERIFRDRRDAEAALLEAFVVEDEAAVVPSQNLHSVTAPAHKGKQVSRVDVLFPLAGDNRHQAVNALSKVERLSSQQDADRSRQREQNELRESSEEVGHVLTVGPHGHLELETRGQR